MVRHSILSATKQVVAGFLYRVQVHMVESECKNTKENEGKLIGDCPAKARGSIATCQIKLWSRSWMPKAEERLIVTSACRSPLAENGHKVSFM